MINIGEMFVRLSATATDVKKGTDEAVRHLGTVETATKRMGTTMTQGSAAMASGLNTVRGAMTSMAGAALSAAPGVAPLASVIGSMAIGTPMMIGVLAGAAAVAFAWDKITASAKAAKEEQQDALGRLLALQRQQALGPGGQTAEDVKQQRIRLGQLAIDAQRLQRELNALPAATVGIGGGAMAATRAGVAARLAAVQAEQQQLRGAMEAGNVQVAQVLREAEEKRLAEQEAAARERQAAVQRANAQELEAMRIHAAKLAELARRQAPVAAAFDPGRDPFGPTGPGRAGMVALGGVAAPGGSGAAISTSATLASDALGMVAESAGGLLARFSPLALISTAIGSALEVMEPAINVLLMPVQALGRLVGGPVNTALSFFAEGLGWLIRSIGKAVNFLVPFADPGNGLVRFGQEMIDAAKAARGAAGGVDELDKAARSAADSVSNMPAIFDLAVRKRQAGAGSIPGTTTTGGVRTAEPRGDVHLHLHSPTTVSNARELKNALRYDAELQTLVANAARVRVA